MNLPALEGLRDTVIAPQVPFLRGWEAERALIIVNGRIFAQNLAMGGVGARSCRPEDNPMLESLRRSTLGLRLIARRVPEKTVLPVMRLPVVMNCSMSRMSS